MARLRIPNLLIYKNSKFTDSALEQLASKLQGISVFLDDKKARNWLGTMQNVRRIRMTNEVRGDLHVRQEMGVLAEDLIRQRPQLGFKVDFSTTKNKKQVTGVTSVRPLILTGLNFDTAIFEHKKEKMDATESYDLYFKGLTKENKESGKNFLEDLKY